MAVAGRHDAEERRRPTPAFVRAQRHPVLAADRNPAQSPFSGVVIDVQIAVFEIQVQGPH